MKLLASCERPSSPEQEGALSSDTAKAMPDLCGTERRHSERDLGEGAEMNGRSYLGRRAHEYCMDCTGLHDPRQG